MKLSGELGGTVRRPPVGENTPETAVVDITLDGEELSIDFMGHVKGVRENELKKHVIEILLPAVRAGEQTYVSLPLMHPLHCLISRVANVKELGRSDFTAMRQLEASVVIVREFISLMLDNSIEEAHAEPERRSESAKQATRVIQDLFSYLKSDINGRDAHLAMHRDPLDILRHFEDDQRFPDPFRLKTIKPMIDEITQKRAARAERRAQIGTSR